MKKNFLKKAFPLFLIALMVFSTFGIVISQIGNTGESKSVNYQGHDFQFDGQQWFSFKGKERIDFLFGPYELEPLLESVDPLLNGVRTHTKTYVSLDPEEEFSQESQFLRSLLIFLTGKQVIAACQKEGEGCVDLPLKNCGNAISNEVFVISLVQDTENKATLESSCFTLSGDSAYFIRIGEGLKLRYVLDG